MIDIDNISFSYKNADRMSLEGINLDINPGEVILLCGQSGCGKTTLTRFLNGLIPNFFEGKRDGNVYLNKKLIGEMPIYEISEHMGSVFKILKLNSLMWIRQAKSFSAVKTCQCLKMK